ncbi:MAG: response regulator transcription factor [Oscillospiraceae bacterium]|nr:response regulator transcription factor [Oscillospiraceae bacterium]
MRILIAEDEVGIAKALKLILEKNRFSVDMVHNGTDALDYLLSVSYDAVVLDIMMPGLDGLEVLSRAREAGVSAPVLFLSAKAEVEDRVAGLDAGADDYLPKPFATSEFISRVKALTRRNGSYVPELIRLGNTTLDLSGYTLSTGDRSVRLNNKEFQLMELFMRNRGRVFSTENLMDKVWGLDSDAEIDVVWTYIGFLRKKLKQLCADIEIKTIRGAGYALEVTEC